MKKFLISIVTIITIILIFNMYPKSGSFNDLVVNKYLQKPFTEIVIDKCSTKVHKKIVKDANKINEFLSYLDKFKFREYKREIPYKNGDIYNIGIYDNNNNLLGITIKNENYIEVYIISGKTRENKKYKIINDKLDIDYIEKF